jgi:hypothetical protein
MTDIQLHIPAESWKRIMDYTTACEVEINGFADVTYNRENKQLVVGQVYPLIKQKADGAEVEIAEEDMDEFMRGLMEQGITQMPRLQWHSHVYMTAFFSSVDQELIDSFDNESFMVALVVNKRGEAKATLKICRPIPVQIDNIEVVIGQGSQTIDAAIIAEVKAQVSQAKAWNFKKGKKKNKDDYYYDTYGNDNANYTDDFPNLAWWEEAHIKQCKTMACKVCDKIYAKMTQREIKLLEALNTAK